MPLTDQQLREDAPSIYFNLNTHSWHALRKSGVSIHELREAIRRNGTVESQVPHGFTLKCLHSQSMITMVAEHFLNPVETIIIRSLAVRMEGSGQ